MTSVLDGQEHGQAERIAEFTRWSHAQPSEIGATVQTVPTVKDVPHVINPQLMNQRLAQIRGALASGVSRIEIAYTAAEWPTIDLVSQAITSDERARVHFVLMPS